MLNGLLAPTVISMRGGMDPETRVVSMADIVATLDAAALELYVSVAVKESAVRSTYMTGAFAALEANPNK